MLSVGVIGAEEFVGKRVLAELKNIKGISAFGCDGPDILSLRKLSGFVRGKDIIVHASGINRGTEAELIEGNIVGTYTLLSALKATKTKPRIIYLSSTQVGGDSFYGKTKELAELMLINYSTAEKAFVTIFRIANEFGEDGRPFYNSVITTFCHQLAHGKELSVNPNPKKFNFVYSGDIAKIVTREVLKKGNKLLKVKDITSKNEATVSEVADILIAFSKNGKRHKLKSKFERDLFNTYKSYLIKK